MSDVQDTLERVHREVEPSMGALAMAIVRRRVNIPTLEAWAEQLERGAVRLRALASRMRGERHEPR